MGARDLGERLSAMRGDPMKGGGDVPDMLDGSGSRQPIRSIRRRVYEIIEIGQADSRVSQLFDGFIVALIILNVAAFVV